MARDAQGTYNLPEAPFVPGTKIKAAPINNVLADLAEALTGCLPRDGSVPVSGDLDVEGRVAARGVRSSGPVRSGDANAFRAVQGGYGVFLRNNGATALLMQTAPGDPDGIWNAHRPLAWDLSTGALALDATGRGASFGGPVAIPRVVPADGTLEIGGAAHAEGDLSCAGKLATRGALDVFGAASVGGAMFCAGALTCGPGGSFAANTSPLGYQMLPGGVCVQWGSGTANQYGGLSFAWPTAFRSALRGFAAIARWGAPRAVVATQGVCDRFGGTVWLTYGEGTPAVGADFSYLAVGI